MDCSLSATLPKPKTVSVNGAVIPREVIAQEVQNHPAEKPILAWQAAARALVVRELLLQEATRLGVEAEPLRDPDGRTETAEEAAMRTLIEQTVATPEVEEVDCRQFYDQNQARFVGGALFEAAHILIAAPRHDVTARKAARAEAEAILKSVRANPARFADVARDRSDCRTSAENGGSLGQVSEGQTVAEFEAGLRAMPVGEFAVVDTRYGSHVVRLDQRAPAKVLPFAHVRARIADYLATAARHRALARYLAELAARADIRGIELTPPPTAASPEGARDAAR